MELTSQEKRVIVESHIKNALTNMYNLQISLIAEQAKDNPNSDITNSLNEQIAVEMAKRDALMAELEKI